MKTGVGIVDCDSWSPARWHRVGKHDDDKRIIWRVTDAGIETVPGDTNAPHRTKGEPVTLNKIYANYHTEISDAADVTRVSRRLVAGIIAAESKGMPVAERSEPQLNDASIGLAQVLTNTAAGLVDYAVAHTLAVPMGLKELIGLKSMPHGGDIETWRKYLRIPHISIALCAIYLKSAEERQDLRRDPVLCYAAYNAGSAVPSDATPWGLKYYRKVLPNGVVADAMNNFVAWYGDACATFGYDPKYE